MDSAQLLLTPKLQAEAERIEDILLAKARVEAGFLARQLASEKDRDLLGAAEFQVETPAIVWERLPGAAKKSAIKGRRRPAVKRPSS